MKLKLIILIQLLTIFTFMGCDSELNNNKEISINGFTMGTTYSIKIITDKDNINLKNEIDSVLIDFNNKMSTYIDNSELSQFNNYLDTNWYDCSKDLAYIFHSAVEISKQTDGYYDITIGPLVNLWGFGPEKREVFPTDSEITERKKNIGYQNINVDTINYKVKKKISELYCDLSSIAKGMGVDQVAEYLKNKGYNDLMVEIGGEIKTYGYNIKNKKWLIAVNSPINDNQIIKVLNISNLSVATSGDYRNYKEKNGKRFSHLINPKDGKPINHNLASVTVLYKNCMIADALATAINVMGPKEGYSFANNNKIPVYMIIRNANKFEEIMNDEFKKMIIEE